MQVDPLSDDPSQLDLSPYHFSRNNPINLNDPTGLCSGLDCLVNKILSFINGRGDGNAEEVASQAEAINKVHALGVRSNESTEKIKDGVSYLPGGGFAMNMAEGDYLGAAIDGGIDVAGGKIIDGMVGLLRGGGDDVVEEGGEYVYRALREGEDPSKGLVARAPDANVSPLSHVAGKAASQWISTTKNLGTAMTKFDSGNGIVRIDMNIIKADVVDLSNGGNLPRSMMRNWAIKDQEVLIKGSIPAEALKVLPIYPVKKGVQ